MLEQERQATAKVLAAVPDERARLQAGREVADGVGPGHPSRDRRRVVSRQHHRRQVRLRSRGEKQAAARFKTVKDVVEYYNREIPAQHRSRFARCRPRS